VKRCSYLAIKGLSASFLVALHASRTTSDRYIRRSKPMSTAKTFMSHVVAIGFVE
jgi:hypothetical protein